MKTDDNDGNSTQWEKLQAMRQRKGEVVTEPKPETTSEQRRVSKPAAAAPADAAPHSTEIEIDGQKVAVDPSLAAAFEKAEKIRADGAKNAERDALKAELRDELRAELSPPPKTEAEKAADAALKAAEEAAKLPKKPDTRLLITDPYEWELQQNVYEEARIKAATNAAKAETLATIQKQNESTAKSAEEHARGILREQFYAAYPVLKDSAAVVDGLMNATFDEIVASGKLNKPMTPQEQESLKREVFADIAAVSTKKVVSLMNAAKKVAPPLAPASTAVSSTTTRTAAPEKKVTEAPRERYPAGSLSALMEARRAARA